MLNESDFKQVKDTKLNSKASAVDNSKEKVEEKVEELNLNLKFSQGGWCEALQKSYAPGYYTCKNLAEYNALKKFAEEIPKVKK